MLRLNVREKLGLAVAAAILTGFVVAALGQDLASALAPVKGKKCQVYLKSGEVRKGKLIKFGDDYITLEVKLSPFYAEPQTYQITQVDRIEYGKNRFVDVDQLLGKSGSAKSSEASKSGEQVAVGTSNASGQANPASSSKKSSASSDDDTVQRLMAILKSLDDGAATKPDEGSLAAVTEPSAGSSSTAKQETRAASKPQQPVQQVRPKTTSRTTTQVATRPQRARKVVVPLTRKTVRTEPVRTAAVKSSPQQAPKRRKQTAISTSRRKRTSRAVSTSSQGKRRTAVRKPRPRKTIPVPKPQKTRLADLSPSGASVAGTDQRVSTGAEQQAAVVKKVRPQQKALESTAEVASSRVSPPAREASGEPVLKAVTVLAGAVGLLALAVLALAVVVLRRHKAATEPLPAAQTSPPKPVATEEPRPEPMPEPPAPIHVVMVKGDYAVVDHGLDHGIKVGELLLLRRAVEDGEYEIGLARVLKVFDRLSGVKLIERWVETDLRVGDSAVRYRPAEPGPEELTSVAVKHVGGRPHPEAESKPATHVAHASLSGNASSQQRGGWPPA